MAKYTLLLKTLIDNNYSLGLTDYPIFDENHRTELNEKIKDHFMMYQIGYETPQLFVFALNRRMREIMPKYNEMYKTLTFTYDVEHNVNMTETFTHSVNNTNNATTTVADNSNNYVSALPNQKITKEDIDSGSFLSEADVSTGNTTNTSNGGGTQTETYSKTQLGRTPSFTFGTELQMYRDNILNVDMDIINELEDLFISLWN